MADIDKVFAGSIPRLYDTLMVPLIFEVYAAHMAALVAAGSPAAVLETAAGSGAVTRSLAPRLGTGARYVVTDLNQPMLDYAAARQGPDRRIEWRQADALALPFAEASFDVVCCQFGAMFFADRIAGYAEARRVLRGGGRFVLSVWGRIQENAFADAVTDAMAAVFPADPPRFLARTPHGYHDVALIRADLRRAAMRGARDVWSRLPLFARGDVAGLFSLSKRARTGDRARGAGHRQPPWAGAGGRQDPGPCDRGGEMTKTSLQPPLPTTLSRRRRMPRSQRS